MNKDEVKHVMAIIRPAIYALYGRQKLKLSAYSKVNVQYAAGMGESGMSDISGWFEVHSIDYFDGIYRLEIKEDVVTSLATGELDV